MGLPQTITDDRGARWRMAPGLVREASQPGDVTYRIWSTVALLVVVAPFLFMGGTLVTAALGGQGVLVSMVVVVVLLVLAIGWVWRAENRARIDWMRGRGRCVVCAYDIRGLAPAAADGATSPRWHGSPEP